MRVRWTEPGVVDLTSICDLGADPGTRELVLAPWLVVYSVNDDAVEILRILHGAQKRP